MAHIRQKNRLRPVGIFRFLLEFNQTLFGTVFLGNVCNPDGGSFVSLLIVKWHLGYLKTIFPDFQNAFLIVLMLCLGNHF